MTRRVLLLLPVAAAVAFVIALVVLHRPAPPRAPLRFALGRGPTIVLLHGAGSSVQDWLPTARRLGRDHHVVLVELPGHGLSPLSEPVTLERAAEALHAALAAESKEPVVLVGHGVGGLVATAEALEHPERVRALVLVETALRPQADEERRRAMLDSIERDYERVLRETCTGMGRDSAQAAQLHARMWKMDPAAIKPWLRLELLADVSLRMRHLLPPLLAVFGERTWPREQEWPAAARSLGYSDAPNVTPVRIPTRGRFPMLDRPDELAHVIAQFARDARTASVAAR